MLKFTRYRLKLMLIISLLLGSFLMLGMQKTASSKDEKIFKNIFIQDIDVGGLNLSEAKLKVKKVYEPKTIELKYNDKVWRIYPKDIDLDFNVDNSVKKAYKYTRSEDNLDNIKRIVNLSFAGTYEVNLHSSYDEVKLTEIIDKISEEIDVQVQEATLEIKDSGEIVRTPSKEGIELDVVKLKEEIYNMLAEKQIKNTDLPINIIKPTITTEDVNSIDTILGQYSTGFNDHTSRGSNIHVAGKSSSDRLVMPMDTFSYNKSTGARTWSNGYKSAKVIVGGRYVNGEGGGVCQVSTTIYNAALLAGMEIEEVHNHTYPSRYAPKGRDAAVSYGYTDLKFKNPYSHPVYIKNIVNNGAVTSKIYGCSQDRERIYLKCEEKYEKEKIMVKTYRIYLDEENNKIREELISNNKYKMK